MKYLFLISNLLCFAFANSQVDERQVDSLNKIVNSKAHDTIRFQALSDLNWTYAVSDPSKAREYALLEIGLSGNLKPIFKAQAYNDLSIAYIRLVLLDSGLVYSQKAYEIRKSIGRKDLMASSLSKIGNIYSDMGKFTESLKSNLEALKIYESLNDKMRLGLLYNNIGTLYQKLDRYDLFELYCQKSLSACTETGNEYGAANALGNLASCAQRKGDKKKTFEWLKRIEEIYIKYGDSVHLANVYNNMGRAHRKFGSLADGKKYYKMAIAICRNINDVQDLILYLYNLSSVEKEEGHYAEAEKLINEAMRLTQQSNSEQMLLNFRLSAIVNAYLGKPKQTESFVEKYVMLRDSLFSVENSSTMAKMQTLYETEKQSLEIKNLEKDKTIQDVELKKRRSAIIGISIGLALAIVLVIVVLRSYAVSKRKSRIIEEQKKDVELQRDKVQIQNVIIEEKKQEILDSINYARRIQEAILPPMTEVQKKFPESFVLYKPKDIVAGDFYWMYEEESLEEPDEKENAGMSYNPVLIAAADCTGHGVPGAFMSLLGKENLDKSLNVSASPGGILSELNRNIKRALQQNKKEDATRDGMDIVLIKKQGNKIWYSGANRPLWIKRKNSSEIEEIKATKNAIGGFTDDEQVYTEHELDLATGDLLYLFTDGYADQFGGEGEKKLTTRRFKEILVRICDNTASEQKNYLENFIQEWKGQVEQVDDILVIGIRI
jgi:serine phosphatase RsbU (regulator of sigma subunit)/tetratricopeptide (TPR) repeat protein